MRTLSLTQKNRIISMLDAGHSAHSIASTTGVHSPTNIRHAVHLITTRKAENVVQVTKSLKNITNQSRSPSTVCLHLKKAGMKAVVKTKRPLLSAKHCKARLDYAYAHKDWTVEDWRRVVWSDETKINCLGSDECKWVWKRPEEGLSDRLVEGTVKFEGGSIIIWGCMTWKGVGYAAKIDGRMDSDLYLQILKDDLLNTLEYHSFNPPDIIFQQDNDPKHTSKKVKEWLEEQEFRTMVWPAQSPNLNPIEHLWGFLKRRLAEYKHPPSGIHELWERIQVEWEKIAVEECQKLVESMPRRIQTVLKAKGGYTKY